MTDKPLTDLETICPPHDFRAGWRTDENGVIYCRLCGEVRELEAQRVEASETEKIK